MITYAELQGPHYHYPGQSSYARPTGMLNGMGRHNAHPAELEGHYPGQYPSHVHLSGLGRFGGPWSPGKLAVGVLALWALSGLIKPKRRRRRR